MYILYRAWWSPLGIPCTTSLHSVTNRQLPTVSHSVLTAVFPGETGLASFIGAKDDENGGNNWSYKTCKAPVKSSPPTNWHPVFYRPDAFPVIQPTASEDWKEMSRDSPWRLNAYNCWTGNVDYKCHWKTKLADKSPHIPAWGATRVSGTSHSCMRSHQCLRYITFLHEEPPVWNAGAQLCRLNTLQDSKSTTKNPKGRNEHIK